MNTRFYVLCAGSLPSNTVANPKGELKAITTQSGLVLNEPSVHIPPPFINPEEDECEEEILTDQDNSEFTIKVLPPPVQQAKPPKQRDFVIHRRDPRYPNIPYPSRMNQEKQREKDETVNDDTYDDPFDFKEEKIKDSKILIDELDLPESNNVLPFLECDSVFYEDFSGVSLGQVFLLGLLVFAMVAACASRDTTKILEFKTSRDRYGDNEVSDPIGGLVFKGSSGTGLLPSGRVDLTGDEDPTDEDGDIRMGDSTGVSMSLGGEISSGGNKSQESNIGDSDNTRDGDTTVGGAIGA
ncbi:hypothetical protein Tco_1090945 [Tanacetum coccineum]|uniref:Uncharacterized protein n=1 Tax=Tanacetum coccineum TaxID=301880 RepID=A0ABQ5I7J8_9ASTR